MEKIDKKDLLNNKYFIILIIILALGFFLRLYYFNVNSAVWWDESDYLLEAKKIALGDSHTELKDYDLNPRRPFLLPLIWAGLYSVGGGETSFRFVELLFSFATLVLIYLFGKELFDKKIALIATFLMSVFWLDLFVTGRLLTDTPSAMFWILTLYLFYKGYLKENANHKYLWLAGISFGLAVFSRAASLLMIIPLGLIIVLKDKFNFIKNKNIWIAGVLSVLVMTPFLIWLGLNYDSPIQKFTGIGESRFSWGMGFKGILGFLYNFPTHYLLYILFILFIIGLLYLLFNLIIGADFLFKKEGEKQRKLFLLLIWIIVPIYFFGYWPGALEDRYILGIFPAVFYLVAFGAMNLYNYISKYQKPIALVIVLFLIIFGAYYQFDYGRSIIDSKKNSYLEIKEAALWVKERSTKEDYTFTISYPQHLLYSERPTYALGGLDTKEKFEAKVKELKPKYMILSAYEAVITPPWMLNYPMENKDKMQPVQAYFMDEEQTKPLVVIYEFKY